MVVFFLWWGFVVFWSFLGEVTALDYSQVTHVKDKGGENRIELAKA